MAANPSDTGVQSVLRAFKLIEKISEAGGPIEPGDLSTATDLPLSATHRLLRTFAMLGYIRRLGAWVSCRIIGRAVSRWMAVAELAVSPAAMA